MKCSIHILKRTSRFIIDDIRQYQWNRNDDSWAVNWTKEGEGRYSCRCCSCLVWRSNSFSHFNMPILMTTFQLKLCLWNDSSCVLYWLNEKECIPTTGFSLSEWTHHVLFCSTKSRMRDVSHLFVCYIDWGFLHFDETICKQICIIQCCIGVITSKSFFDFDAVV